MKMSFWQVTGDSEPTRNQWKNKIVNVRKLKKAPAKNTIFVSFSELVTYYVGVHVVVHGHTI